MNNNLNSQLPKIDQKTKALISLLVGIVLVGAWISALVIGIGLDFNDVLIVSLAGLMVSTAGVIFGIKGLKSTKKNCAIIGIVLCLLVLLFSAYMLYAWLISGGPFYL